MSKRTDLREIQRLTEDAAIDARKLLIQADNLPPDTFQKMLEALCGSFEDTALQLRRLCEQQSPGTGGYKRGRALRPLEVVGSVERIGIDWLHILHQYTAAPLPVPATHMADGNLGGVAGCL